jgi:hypothetical protein
MTPETTRTVIGPTSRTMSPRRKSCGLHARPRFAQRLALAVLLLIAIGLSKPPAYAQPSSEPSVVELSVAEADSILARIEHLEVDLWEARALAQQDSLFYEDRLRLQEQAYERMLDAYKDERPNWLERVLKHPSVWLALGMWIGVQAVQ